MASVINQINVGGVEYAIAHSAAAVCNSSAAEVNKTADVLTDNDRTNNAFTPIAGVTLVVFFMNGNTASNATLSVNGSTAYPLILKDYNDTSDIPVPPNYFTPGIPYYLFFNGVAWLPVAARPAVAFKTWGAND